MWGFGQIKDLLLKWRLKLNSSKTVSTFFHLNNREANVEMEIKSEDQRIKHKSTPKYLGVTLDRTLNYRKHLKNTVNKLKTRNNIIAKLDGTKWGANTQTLRTSDLVLVYSAAVYCSSIWLNSKHTNKIDTQLNQIMRMITGSLKSTPLAWLLVMANIPPPGLRREEALRKEWKKYLDNPNFPIRLIINSLPHMRLKSRNPAWNSVANININESQVASKWIDIWKEESPNSNHLFHDPISACLVSISPENNGYSLIDSDLIMGVVHTL
jgi:hypothetical protein